MKTELFFSCKTDQWETPQESSPAVRYLETYPGRKRKSREGEAVMDKSYEEHNFAYIDPHCIGCHYYAGIADNIYYCSYFTKEDRLRPCPPGKGCTVRINREDYKTKEKKILEKQQKKLEKPVRKNEVLLTYKGETKPLAEWARMVGINGRTLYYRIKIMGWSVEKALETPTKTTGNGKKKEGVKNG